jgi:hypothetical protein
MSAALQFSAWMYERMLLLYPEELRRDFGSDMAMAFAADLEQSGMLRVWWCALCELVTVALPEQRSNPFFLSPVLAFITTAMAESVFVGIGIHQLPSTAGSDVAAMWLAVLWVSAMNAFVAFVVTWFYSRCAVNVLRLD